MQENTLVRVDRRDRIRRSMEPIAKGFGRLGLTPNALTLIGFGIAVVAAFAAASQAWLAAGLFVIFAGAFDLLDGALARATGRTTKLGAFLDSTFDRWGEAVVYLGIIWGLAGVGFILGPQIAAAAMGSAFMVSYVRAKSESLGFTPGTGMASVGLAPREVRIIILTVGLISAGILPGRPESGRVMFFPLSWLVLVGSLALIAFLGTITTVQRIFHVYREAQKQERE